MEKGTCKKLATAGLKPVGELLLFLVIISLPYSTYASISVISELTNNTVADIEDAPAKFIPDRFAMFGIEVPYLDS
jgi:hypothetical protein